MIGAAVLLSAAIASPTTPHGAEAWASCLWEADPKAAANWLAMPVEDPVGFDSGSAYKRLAFRLRSTCWDRLVRSGQRITFDETSIRQALVRSKPARDARKDVQGGGWVCRAWKGKELVAEYFGWSRHKRIKLYDGVSRVDCSGISSDGSLVSDA